MPGELTRESQRQPCCCDDESEPGTTTSDGTLWCAGCGGELHLCVGGCGALVGGSADEFPYCARCLFARMTVIA